MMFLGMVEFSIFFIWFWQEVEEGRNKFYDLILGELVEELLEITSVSLN